MSTITEVTTEAEFHSHLASIPPTTLVIISFHAPWAAPCAQMATVLQTLAATYPITNPPGTLWLSLNAEDLSEISEIYDVTAVPFLALVRNKQVLETVSGSDATKVRSAIDKHANQAHSADTAPEKSAHLLSQVQKSKAVDANGTKNGDGGSDAPGKDESTTAPDSSSSGLKGPEETLHKRLSNLVKAAPVMLFMKGTPSSPQCGFSRQVVAILREQGVKYGFFNILADEEIRTGLKEFADWPTYPQLWMDGELVGGLDIVKEEIASNAAFFEKYIPNSNPAPVTSS